MKQFLPFILLTFLAFNTFAQSSGSIRGKILGQDNRPLPGASVIISGTSAGVNTNEQGEYLFTDVPAGKLTIRASCLGYKTGSMEYTVRAGENSLDLTLEFNEVKLKEVAVVSQKREQQLLDVPVTMSVVRSDFLEDNHINGMEKLSEFVPGFLVRMQGQSRPSFVVRGLTSDEVSPAAQPRISVFCNNVPINRANGAAVALFDMQQVEVLKGPQGTLFGRGAEIGAINYITEKPCNRFGGYLTAGLGSYLQKSVEGAFNLPILKNKLMLRVAGIYDYQDGFIKNTFGGNLNGKNTVAGRFSLNYLPGAGNRIELVMNVQKDDNPGLGFMSMSYPNTEGSKDPFDYKVSNEQGKNLADQRDIMDATLTMKHFFNPSSYLTSISSYRRIDTYSRWDGDGTAAAAIDMSEDDGSGQFYQEVRYNYSLKNKLNGSLGASYWYDKSSQDYWFSPNEQDMFHLFFNTGYLVGPTGQPNPVSNLPMDPQLGPLGGAPMVTNHQEENNNDATNRAVDAFADASYRLTTKLSVTAGLRLTRDWIKLSNSAGMTGGDPSTLGYLSGNYPNLFFKPSDEKEISTGNLSLTYRAGLKYELNENSGLYFNYSNGRRPKVLQFTSAGEEQLLDAEVVNSFDLGIKTALQQRLWFDLGLFYYDYSHFQTSAWVADAGSGEFNYIVKDGGKASGYGAEASMNYAALKGLYIFGNYAYIHSRFANKDVDGAEQEYSGNSFRLTPEHSFAIGLNARVYVWKSISVFAVPSYAYKTKIFFEDANTPGLEQDGYGLLDVKLGVDYRKFTLAFWASNLLDEHYIVSAGNTGSLFGDPTLIAGAPRMMGSTLHWKF